jgi:LPXTG-motif cell wall-anchored protein
VSQALQEGGKLLENAAITQNKVNDSVNKVINSGTQKSSFQFNFVLLGFALLILAAYAFVSRRKAS